MARPPVHIKHRLRGYFSILALCTAATLCSAQVDPLTEARALLNADRVAESETALRAYLLQNADSADAHFLLGYVLFREQRAKDSLAEFTAGAKYRRPKADELKVVASDYVMLGGFSDADKWFSEVVKETPNDGEAWYLLGRTKYSETEFAAAISDFENALSLRPKYVEAENNIGLAWRELGNSAEAQAAFQRAIEWQGTQPVDAQPFLNLGTLLADAGKNDQALGYLLHAESLAPINPTVHEELARVYANLQKLSEAEAELKAAVKLAPSTSALHFKLGQIYRKEGLIDQAQQEFTICKQLSAARSSKRTPNPLTIDAPGSR